MLVASYVLISLGGTKIQLRRIRQIRSNQYDFFFPVCCSHWFLYAMTGTLNMAHLSVRVAQAGQGGLMTVIALLFLIVFSIKAWLFLFFWLPDSYSAPPTAVAAIFAALLTKVGVYAIIRVFSLVFYHEPSYTHMLIGILAALSMVLGAIGAVAYWDIKKIITYNVVVGVGFILAGFASFSLAGMRGSLYYLIHDMIVKALLFLLGGTIIHLTGTSKIKAMSGLIRHPQLVGCFSLRLYPYRLPPLSGFIGKIFITEGTFQTGYFWLGESASCISLMVLYSVMKIFMNVFGDLQTTQKRRKKEQKGLLLPLVSLLL